MWTIALPLQVPLPRKKTVKLWPLNLNVYRNSHPHTLNQAKVSFDEIAGPLIRKAGIPKLAKCTLEYILYTRTAQLCDTNNICCIADKFFSDSLVNHGVIEDDNYKFVVDSRSRFGGIDRQNPRVDVVVRSPDHIPTVPKEPLYESHEPMKITTTTISTVKLTQTDVEDALREYLAKHLTVASNAAINVKETKEGYEIRVEQEGSVETHGASSSKSSKKTAKQDRLEPKEAMAALPSFARVVPVQEPAEAPAAVQEALPLVGEEKGHADAPPAAEAQAEASPSQEEEKQPEAPPPAKVPSLFANFKRPSNP